MIVSVVMEVMVGCVYLFMFKDSDTDNFGG